MALNPPVKSEVIIAGSDGQKRICQPLPGETQKAFAAFVTYLVMGDDRTLTGCASKLGRKSVSCVTDWSRKWRWQERVVAWNRRVLEVQREAYEALAVESAVDWARRQRELRESEWEIVQKAIALVKRMMDKLLAKEGGKITVADVSRLLEIASKVGRLSTGLATERGEVGGLGGGPIQVELSAALQKVYGVPFDRLDAPDDKNALAVPLRSELGQSCSDSEPQNVPRGTGEGDLPENGTSKNDPA